VPPRGPPAPGGTARPAPPRDPPQPPPVQQPQRLVPRRPRQVPPCGRSRPARQHDPHGLGPVPKPLTSSRGSSARAVPPPTSTASCAPLSRWTSLRAAGPVIQRLSPDPWRCARRATRRASASPTAALRRRAAGSPGGPPAPPPAHADRDLDARRPQPRDPCAVVRGSGSPTPRRPARPRPPRARRRTDRRARDARRAPASRRPWPPRVRLRERHGSAWGRPPSRRPARPTTRPSRTITQPTAGRPRPPRPRRPSASASVHSTARAHAPLSPAMKRSKSAGPGSSCKRLRSARRPPGRSPERLHHHLADAPRGHVPLAPVSSLRTISDTVRSIRSGSRAASGARCARSARASPGRTPPVARTP
jgi:hypothetical protein